MSSGAALERAIVRARMAGLRPADKLSLSVWADRYFVLSAETAAEPGRWRTLPYQRGIMDAITDPDVTQVTVEKSARVGYTLMLSAAIGYFIEHEPSSMLVVQPTVDDAKNFSKETIAPMLRDVPVLAETVFRDREGRGKGPKDASATLLHKKFPGGVLSLVGANSGAGFRRVSRRVVMFDEVDAYPASAGTEGDQIKLGMMRSQAFWNRKAILGSTPLTSGASRIEEEFERGDRRRYHVPCPHCGHMDFFAFRESERGGHFMRWPDGKPEEAFFVCKRNGCIIEHKDKRWMVEHGEWRAEKPGGTHRSFHLWAAVSYAPNATWGHIASEFVAANAAGPEKLKTFINTVLGETWHEKGEAPDWEKLFLRREDYPAGSVPAGVRVLTSGVDVQKDSLRWEVVGWGARLEQWSVDKGVIAGDTADEATWHKLDELLVRTFPGPEGLIFPIAMMAVDSGYNTQHVYNWAGRHVGRVLAVKGVASQRTILGTPKAVEVAQSGKARRRGTKVWSVGVDVVKTELYGLLRLPRPAEGEPPPPGFCHFPADYDEEFFKQLTAEHLVTGRKRSGFTIREWRVQPGRENHFLDARVYARAAAAQLGVDRISDAPPPPSSPRRPTTPAADLRATGPGPSPKRPGGWLGGGGGPRRGGGGWLGKRR